METKLMNYECLHMKLLFLRNSAQSATQVGLKWNLPRQSRIDWLRTLQVTLTSPERNELA